MLAGKFRPFDIDDFRHDIFPSGPGGTVAFGTMAAVVQGVPQLLLGWSAGVDIAANLLLVVLSLIGDPAPSGRHPEQR